MADSSLTDAICNAVATARTIDQLILRSPDKTSPELLSFILLALDAAVKESNSLVERAAEFRACYPTPPIAIGGEHAASYHEMGRSLASNLFWGVCLIVNPLSITDESVKLPPDAKALEVKWPQVLAYLKRRARRFKDCNRLIALIQDEAARAAIRTAGGGAPPTAKPEPGEGSGGADAILGQEKAPSIPTREAALRQLEPAARKAYLSCEYAERKAEKRLKGHVAHKWLEDNEIDTDRDDVVELADYKLPAFDTWSRQLRKARSALGEQRHTRRAGRATGRSIISGHEIEYQERDACS